MRKTKLVILPGVRTLNRIGCLLLFLACPTIAFKGQENREVEPVSKLLSLNEIWFATEPKRGEICLTEENKPVSDANAMLEYGKTETNDNVRVSREAHVPLTRSESRAMDRVSGERARREARSLTRERLSKDYSQRRQDLTARRESSRSMNKRDSRVMREDRRATRDTRVRDDERRVVRLSRDERERRVNRISSIDREVSRMSRGERERQVNRLSRDDRERLVNRVDRRVRESRERENERLAVSQRREREGERFSRRTEGRQDERLARREAVRLTREREDDRTSRRVSERQTRDTRSEEARVAERRINGNRIRQDRLAAARRSVDGTRRSEFQRDRRSMVNVRRIESREVQDGRAGQRREATRRPQEQQFRRVDTVRRQLDDYRHSLIRTDERSLVRSDERFRRVSDENNNQIRQIAIARRAAKLPFDSRPPTDVSVIFSNDIPTTGKFKEMTAWLWKEKDLTGWLERVNYGSIITTGITCFALYMTTNRKTASY